MIKQIFDVIKNHSMNGIHVIHKKGYLCSFYLNFVNKQTQYCWNNCILIISYHHWLDYHASQIWLLEVLCSARRTGGFLPFSPPSYVYNLPQICRDILLCSRGCLIVLTMMYIWYGFYTNISSSFMPCTINKKGPYFVTESLFH